MSLIADAIFFNGRVHLHNGEELTHAFAVREGRFIAVGDSVAACVGAGTTQHDLQGASVVPGFVDVHAHHVMAGQADLFELTFSSEAALEEVLDAVAQWPSSLASNPWVIGGSWGSALLPELQDPGTRARFDRAAGGRPLSLVDDTHHNRYVNSAGLARAGITAESENPEGGKIVRDATGEPTGLLLETATILMESAIAESTSLSAEQWRAASRRGVELLNSYGVTAFQDAASGEEMLAALHQNDAAGELNAWVVSSVVANDIVFGYPVVGRELIAVSEEYRSPHHRPDFAKLFMDGVPPTRTAAFLEPYSEPDGSRSKERGKTTLSRTELEEWLRHIVQSGLSAKIHCTGDAAVRTALDAIATVRAEGYDDAVMQIAHGQFVHPDDIDRFRDLRVVADASPFLWYPGVLPTAIAEVRGAEGVFMQPNRTLVDAGVVVAGGSDWPVSGTPNPWEGVQGLITRADPLGRVPGTLWPEQALTRAEALAAFTSAPAFAMGLGAVIGSIEVGKSADFVVLSQDPMAVPVEEIINTVARETWFAGRRVYPR